MSNYFAKLLFFKASQGFFDFFIPSFSFLVILLSKTQTPKLASLMWIVEVVGLQRTVVPMGGVWVGNQRMQVQTRFKEIICGCFMFYFSIFETTVFMHFTLLCGHYCDALFIWFIAEVSVGGACYITEPVVQEYLVRVCKCGSLC